MIAAPPEKQRNKGPSGSSEEPGSLPASMFTTAIVRQLELLEVGIFTPGVLFLLASGNCFFISRSRDIRAQLRAFLLPRSGDTNSP